MNLNALNRTGHAVSRSWLFIVLQIRALLHTGPERERSRNQGAGVEKILRERESGEGATQIGKETQMREVEYSVGIGSLDNFPFPYVFPGMAD